MRVRQQTALEGEMEHEGRQDAGEVAIRSIADNRASGPQPRIRKARR